MSIEPAEPIGKPSIALIGECMIEMSGGQDGYWRMGFAGDTLNTL